MFAPIITPADCLRFNKPAFTRLTVITVVTEEDCTIAVELKPVITPLNLFEVIDPNILRRRSPAVRCIPSLITFIPKINSPRDPIKINSFITPHPLSVLAFTLADQMTSESFETSFTLLSTSPIRTTYFSPPIRFLTSWLVLFISKGSLYFQSLPSYPFLFRFAPIFVLYLTTRFLFDKLDSDA